ncbi:MAG: hypothetical protein GXO13_01750 [Epsilonproteobacteria bacterium]|nr:hypothetical protein [Campylobacterota bacterium]
MKLKNLLINQLDRRFIYSPEERLVEDTPEGLLQLCSLYHYLPKPERYYKLPTAHPRYKPELRFWLFRKLAKQIPLQLFHRYDSVEFIGMGGVNSNLAYFLSPFVGRKKIQAWDKDEWEFHNFPRLASTERIFSVRKTGQMNFEYYKDRFFTPSDFNYLRGSNPLFIGAPGNLLPVLMERGDVLDVFFKREGVGVCFYRRGDKIEVGVVASALTHDNYWKMRVSDYLASIFLALLTIPALLKKRESVEAFYALTRVKEIKEIMVSI